MNSGINSLPELRALDSRGQQIRIPPQADVPLTPRVLRLIETAPFRRLARISQLGLVSQVYPGANHSRFEHSLGVYRTALLYLQRLGHDFRFCEQVQTAQAERFLVAALLHDIGHWPFCHPVEDLQLADIPRHETLARTILATPEFSEILWNDWGIDPNDVANLLAADVTEPALQLLSTMLSGPIDVDKVDYLDRDSLHAGVPYGRNFDRDRLIGSLCLNQSGDGLALTEKGRTAAEMMVFARYFMFSEVYWHHAVRSATAMFQRAFYLLQATLDVERLTMMTEPRMVAALGEAGTASASGELLDGLFGGHRRLFKRALELSALQNAELHAALSRRPYAWLVACTDELAKRLSQLLHRNVPSHHVLLDAPPQKLEVQFKVDIQFGNGTEFRPLHQVSPAVHALASDQFDRIVKRVRLFLHPDVRDEIRRLPDLDAVLRDVVDDLDRYDTPLGNQAGSSAVNSTSSPRLG